MSGRVIAPVINKGTKTMKRDSSIHRGEEVNCQSCCLNLKMCDHNCEASDLLTGPIREGSSRSSSNLIHLDNVNTSKLDGVPQPETDIFQAVEKHQTSHQSKSCLIGAAYKYDSTASLRQTSSSFSDHIEIYQRKRVLDSPTVSTIPLDSKSTITASSSPHIETGKWLELGLGSTCSQVTKHRKVNSGSINFTECCSLSRIKEWNRQPLIPWSGIERDSEKSMNTSFLHNCNQQAYQNLNTQAYSYFPHKLGESRSHRNVTSFISPSSSDLSFLQNARFFSPPQQTTISKQPFVLQNTINRIQSQIPASNHGELSWSRTTNSEPITEPGILDILSRRKFLSEVQIGTPQYPKQLYSEPFLMFEPLQAQKTPLSAKDTDIDKLRRSEAGLWFMLQVAPTQDTDRQLPQISKTYLRTKDGTTTILMVKKYLASKLRLKSESEIEITCKGKQMLPFFTLQQVRDKIWFSSTKRAQHRNNVEISCASPSPSPSVLYRHLCDEYLMILNYERRATKACHPALY